ncbi:MAG: hypothetical protein U0359_32625 [Byssovorax sp.]
MGIVIDLVILVFAALCAVYASAIHARMGEANKSLHRLLAFLDVVHVEHHKERRDAEVASSTFRKTLTDSIRGCRDSIDAIRSVTDELSEHRRETMELRAPPNDRDSAELMTKVLPRPTEAELMGTDSPGSAPVLSSRPAQIAAGLSRPKSPRREPAAARPARTDPPPRSQTILGMNAPGGSHTLPQVVPPPIARSRSAATLPSMGAVSTPGVAAAPLTVPQEKKEICSTCVSGHVRLPGGTIAACDACGGSGLVPPARSR